MDLAADILVEDVEVLTSTERIGAAATVDPTVLSVIEEAPPPVALQSRVDISAIGVSEESSETSSMIDEGQLSDHTLPMRISFVELLYPAATCIALNLAWIPASFVFSVNDSTRRVEGSNFARSSMSTPAG